MNRPSALYALLISCLLATLPQPARAEPDAGGASGITLRRYEEAELVQFPWGWIRWMMNAKADPHAEMTMGIVQVEANQTNPRHLHPNSAEYVHVLSGSCEQLIGDKWMPMKQGDTLRVPKGVIHQARTGSEPCRMMIVYDTGTREMVLVDPKK